MSVDELKKKGNDAFINKDFDQAINWFSQAIELDSKNHILFSNRSGAFCSKGAYGQALKDAQECVKLNPGWAKGYSRLGAAYSGLENYGEALKSYEAGLKIEPDNQAMKEGLMSIRQKFESNPFLSIMQLFQGDIIGKLSQNPKFKEYLKQPDFVQMLEGMKSSPQAVQQYIRDPRITEVLGFLTGIPTQAPQAEPEVRKPAPKKEAEKPKEPVKELSPEEKEAEELKAQGNAAYKSRKFEEALDLYAKAYEKNPNTIVYLNNRSACYFEMGNYEQAIKESERAIEDSKKLFAQPDNFKNVAKAYLRMGKSFEKLGNLEKALECGTNSVTEEKTREAAEFNLRVEKLLSEKKKRDYIDPEKGRQARERGNEFFKNGELPKAVKEYEEAIKRNPEDYLVYSNRAACFTKMMEYHLGIKDCEEGLKIAPDFIKLHTRKALLHYYLKEYDKALECYDKASHLDEKNPPDQQNPEIKEGINRVLISMRERNSRPADEETIRKNAERDPEVVQIMSDPVMQMILKQIQEDPKAFQDHMKNPEVARKIKKLIDVGIIRTG